MATSPMRPPWLSAHFSDSAAEIWRESRIAHERRSDCARIAFDGNRLVGTGTTLPVFNYLKPISDEKKNWWARPAPVGTSSSHGFDSSRGFGRLPVHQIVRTEYSLMGSSFVRKSSPSA